jgi:hypothetical protein
VCPVRRSTPNRNREQSALQTPLRPRDAGKRSAADWDCVAVQCCSAIVMAPENNDRPAPLFDSLPYYDNDLETHPILREKVQHEVAVETQKTHQEVLHPRVPPPIDLFVVSRMITVIPKS